MEINDWITAGLSIAALALSSVALVYSRVSALSARRAADATVSEHRAASKERDEREGPVFDVSPSRVGTSGTVTVQLVGGPDLAPITARLVAEKDVEFASSISGAERDGLVVDMLQRGKSFQVDVKLSRQIRGPVRFWLYLHCDELSDTSSRNWTRQYDLTMRDSTARVYRPTGKIPRSTATRWMP